MERTKSVLDSHGSGYLLFPLKKRALLSSVLFSLNESKERSSLMVCFPGAKHPRRLRKAEKQRFFTAGMLCMIAVCFIGLSAPAWASENGSQHYPIGVLTVQNGTMPPPGMLQLQNYFLSLSSGSLANNTGGNAAPNFSLYVQADAPRFLYTWKPKIGPFHYSNGFVFPITHLSLSVAGAHDSDFHPGDIDIANYLSYASANHKLNYYFGFETYLPVGAYNKNNLVNAGNNFWTFAPTFDVTYKPSPKGELAVSVLTEFNTENSANHYHSGSDIDFDYGTTWRPWDKARKFGFGVQGYFYKQLSDDTQNGAKVGTDGYRGREFGIGPQLRYDWPFGGLVVKYQHEYAVVDRPRGEKVWVEFALPVFGKPKTHD